MRESIVLEKLCMLIFVIIGTIPLNMLNTHIIFFIAWGIFAGIIWNDIWEFIYDKLDK
jgi:hypothetical protein